VNLFLPEKQLEAWAAEEKVDWQEGKLTLEGEPHSFSLLRAIYFVHLESGEDEKKLVGRVKAMTQLDGLGMDQMGESAIIGDTAYRITPGYVIKLDLPKAEQKRPTATEADLLAAFILDKL